MNVLDGLTKQVNGRNLQAKLVLEGIVWFADLHKLLTVFSDEVQKFSASPSGPDEVQKFLQKVHDSAKIVWNHLGADQTALQLLTDVQSKRSPEDLGVEGPPSYLAAKDNTKLKGVLEAFEAKVLDCGVSPEEWKASGIPAHIAEILDSGATVRLTLEGIAGPDRMGHGELDDRMFEVHYSGTGQIGNRHLINQGNTPGLINATAGLLKAMKREMTVIKAGR